MLHVPTAQVLLARWVGLKSLSRIVRVALSLFVVSLSLELALFRTGSGVRTPRVTLFVSARGASLLVVAFPLRTVAIVQVISRTVITIFVSCSPLSTFLFACCWGVERHLRETFTTLA